MPAQPPIIHLFGGCNGAGKTTFARAYLPTEARCLNFLNADYIAQGISPLSPQAGAFKAGRMLLTEFKAFVQRKETFALESTLSGSTYVKLLKDAKAQGFQIYLYYLWLPTPNLALARIRERVIKGGHDVPAIDVRRRFERSWHHFVNDYAPLADYWAVWNNQTSPPSLLTDSDACPLADIKTKI